ncbi:MAG: magnesium transporter [Calditrichaeota bacterium]|nr:magnesium transporter [Calditrichota bacterium]MCB9369217.1 magnesium transporter [Calditrichota bacterium]
MSTRLPEELVYLSSMLGRPAYSRTLGTGMGKVWDVIAQVTEMFPEVKGLVLRNGGRLVLYPATGMEYFDFLKSRRLKVDEHKIIPLELTGDDISIRETLWDRQIVDVEGAKVVRVNDVQLLVGERQWVVHVDVGVSGLARRLGYETALRKAARVLGRKFDDELISWKFVQPISDTQDAPGPVRLKVGAQRLKELHPGEIADILEELSHEQRQVMVASMDIETAAEALEETDYDVQKAILENLEPERAADIIEEMEPSIAADLLSDLDTTASEKIISEFEYEDERAEITELMSYEEETAGALMTTDYLELSEDKTVEDALELLRDNAEEIEAYYYIYVHDDDGVLTGVVSMRNLLLTDPALQIGNIMSGRLITLPLDASLQDIAENFLRYNFLFIPIVDENGVQKGVVSFKDSLDDLMPTLYKTWKKD